jgi:hypothetical protein
LNNAANALANHIRSKIDYQCEINIDEYLHKIGILNFFNIGLLAMFARKQFGAILVATEKLARDNIPNLTALVDSIRRNFSG